MAYQRNFGFGAGVAFAIPNVTNPTPIPIGIIQEATVDFAFTTKQLFGQFQYPVAVGRGTAKISGKLKFGEINSQLLNTLFFGITPAAGQVQLASLEASSIPATPFTITVSNGATFETDYGVAFAATGQKLTRVASAPTTGQYSVNTTTGLYTFAAADTLLAVLISYGYTLAAPLTTLTGTLTNPQIGAAQQFQLDLYTYDPTLNQQWGLRLFACQSSKLSFATKLEDFMVPEIDFEAYANAANQVCKTFMPN
jgi:hypothetical protein